MNLDTTAKDDNLGIALRDVQQSLQRLGKELNVSSTGSNTGPDGSTTVLNKVETQDTVDEAGGRVILSHYDLQTRRNTEREIACNMPGSEWCFVTAESIPESIREWGSVQCGDEVQIDTTMEAKDWRCLPIIDSISRWKYCESKNDYMVHAD